MSTNTIKRFRIRTLGCKANISDSLRIDAALRKRGWLPGAPGEKVDLCVVNSCTVTDEADRQTRRAASRLFREHPEAVVVVTGCAAEVEPEQLRSVPGLHYVIGNRDRAQLVDLIIDKVNAAERGSSRPGTAEFLGHTQSYSEMASRHPEDREWPGVEEEWENSSENEESVRPSSHTRAFLKIQEGCNSFCTYCVIPYGRGPSRSLPAPRVVEQVREITARGGREIVLTGTNLGDYEEGPRDFLELVKRILGETGLERLRVSSLDPTEILPELVRFMEQEPRFCPHFHVSLQSVDDVILKRMKRRYRMNDVRESLERIAAARVGVPGGVFVGMDLITGFPGESTDAFEAGLRTLEALPWSRLHVFPYSERKGTPAVRLGDSVPREERLRRSEQIQTLSLRRLVQWHERVLREAREGDAMLSDVLLEKPISTPRRLLEEGIGVKADQWLSGYSRNYVRVIAPIPAGATMEKRDLRNQVKAFRVGRLLVDSAAGEVSLLADLSDQGP